MSLSVVGLDFANTDRSKSNRRFEMALCALVEQVDLVPEPRHLADPNVAAVLSIAESSSVT
ncbi:MAG: hypothetical protein WC704_14865 [Sphingomonas sp.]|jgi:hypothetical protein